MNILGPESKSEILGKLSEKFQDFTYEAYKSCRCMELISANHPIRIKERSEDEILKKRLGTREVDASWYKDVPLIKPRSGD